MASKSVLMACSVVFAAGAVAWAVAGAAEPPAAAAEVAAPAAAPALSAVELLGKALFFDERLSNPPGQSCASCHAASTGWASPNSDSNLAYGVHEGVVHVRYGNRKAPTSAYAGFTPPLRRCGPMGGGGGMMTTEAEESQAPVAGDAATPMAGGGMGGGGMGGGMCQSGEFVGGLFWDGRATGWALGDPLAEQAMGPFLNPLEMHNPNPKLVCLRVRESAYAGLFEAAFGPGSLDCIKAVDAAYLRVGEAIAAYERSAEVNPFSSKFDRFWRNAMEARLMVPMINGMNQVRFKGLGLTDAELAGLVVFNTKGKCSSCHSLHPRGAPAPLFTDFSFHNLGVPKNPDNPFYRMPTSINSDGANWIDPGLGGFLATTAGAVDASGVSRDYTAYARENRGKHRTPTLRNLDLRPSPEFTKPFGHNGYFKSVMAIVHFYNTRDVLPLCAAETGVPGVDCWPAPEVAANVNPDLLGDLKLTPPEGMALIAFLKTLNDGYTPP